MKTSSHTRGRIVPIYAGDLTGERVLQCAIYDLRLFGRLDIRCQAVPFLNFFVFCCGVCSGVKGLMVWPLDSYVFYCLIFTFFLIRMSPVFPVSSASSRRCVSYSITRLYPPQS